MNAYITQYNFKKIFNDKFHYDGTKRIEGSIELMERIICYYSENEMQRLLAYREFVKDPDHFFRLYNIKFRDTYTYVYENPPAYHIDFSCDLLHSDYSGKGPLVPEEIKKLGNEKIEEYRRFYKSNKALHDKDPHAFFNQVNALFRTHISKEIVDEDFACNSGAKQVSNISLEKMMKIFKHNTEILLKYWENNSVICSNFAKRSYYITNYVRNHGSNVFYSINDDMSNVKGKVFNPTKFDGDVVIKKVKEIQLLKSKMSDQIQKIMLKEYNPSISMDTTLLGMLGFRRCSKCASNVVRTIGTNLIK